MSQRQSIDENRRQLIKVIGALPLVHNAPAWSAPVLEEDGPDPRVAALTSRIRIRTRWYRTETSWRPINALIVSGEAATLLADPMPSSASARALIEAAGPGRLLLLVADRPGAREAIACAQALGIGARIVASPENVDLGNAVARVGGRRDLDARIDAARLRFGSGTGRGASGWFVPFSGQPQWLGPSSTPTRPSRSSIRGLV